jgi:hypothetical protein
MALYGLRVWNAAGNLICDISSRLSRFVGSQVIASASSGSVTVPVAGDIWYAFQPTQIWGFINMDCPRPNFSISGNTLSWSYSAPLGGNTQPVLGTVFYGVK